jgi:SAM-dependent methyltransferase
MDQEEEMQFFYEIFDSSLPRLGPGDDVSTRRALEVVRAAASPRLDTSVPPNLRILDIGCGNGAQTIQLAKWASQGTITAVDNHQSFLDELQRRAETEGLSERIQPCLRDMCAMGMEKGTFDLIWAEGSLYIMGFREGLVACHDLLTPDGFLAVSELCWLRPDAPSECRQFFAHEYPSMVDIDANLGTIKNCGYELLGCLTLPESAWWIPYYRPLEGRLQALRESNVNDEGKLALIESLQIEIEMYRKYSGYYGYVFYVMQPSGSGLPG